MLAQGRPFRAAPPGASGTFSGLCSAGPPGGGPAFQLLLQLRPRRARRAGAQASSRFPGGADVNSFLPGAEERPASTLPSQGGRAANGLRGRLTVCQARGQCVSAPRSAAGLRGPGHRRAQAARTRPIPGRSFLLAEAGRRSRWESYLWRRGWASAPQNTWGPGLLDQVGGGHWARGRPRWPAGRAAAGVLAEDLARAGVTQITLFNYTVPGRRVR